MTHDSVIITVLIQHRGVGKQHETLARYETLSMPVVPGFACAHAVKPADHLDLDESGQPIEPCGWCESQGQDGTRRPVEIVEHEWCNGFFTLDQIAAHIRECC